MQKNKKLKCEVTIKPILYYPLILFVLIASLHLYAEDIIVYTANQNWLSRIYLLRMDGTVINYFQYDFYHFTDIEVVNNELYAAEAFAPRVYKINLITGDLEVIIDDWSLYYFYDVGFDGTYFYTTEWDMHRYDFNGNPISSSPFDGTVFGGTSDSTYYWTLSDSAEIRCWDFSQWPNTIEVTANNFSPPTPECRGLWYDGQYFWSAESKDYPGYIYKFNSTGTVIQQWVEPAFSGWAAGVIKDFITDVSYESEGLPETFVLKQNFPNPFNATTTIEFSLPKTSYTTLKVYNSIGELVAVILAEELLPGTHKIEWDAGEFPSGIYYYQLSGAGFIDIKKMLLLK